MFPFDRVKLKRPNRTVFKYSPRWQSTIKIGEVIPSCAWECVPGDTFSFGQVASVEFMPMISPFKGDIFLESCAFFVPFDILALDGEDKFTDILTAVTDTQSAVPIPKWNFDDIDEDTAIGTLWDKLGFPIDLTALDDKVTPLAYLQRAYNIIYNEYIRDETIDEEVDLTSNAIQTCCYRKDLFTSAFNSPQKGVAPTLPLTGYATLDVKYPEGYVHTDSLWAAGVSSSQPLKIEGSPIYGVAGLKEILENSVIVNPSQIVSFDINQLRLLNKLQLWLERNQLAGTRAKEYLLANYGVAPNDETLQRPAFIGRMRTSIIVNSLQASTQSQYTSGGTTQDIPQGMKSGNAYGSNAVYFGNWTCKEPGLIMILSFLRPIAYYSQGINRSWIKNSVYDFFNPIFEGLGQQEIYNAEIYAQGTDDDFGIFGYTDRYNELRCMNNVTTGELRAGESLQTWSCNRNFTSLPTLSSEFIHVNPKDYNYLFSLPSKPHAIITFDNVIKGIRPLRKFAIHTL